MSGAPNPATDPATAGSAPVTATATAGAPPATTSGTGWPKLARGEIPSTWSKPAEIVSTLPTRAKATSAAGPIVGVVVALGTAALVFVALPSREARPPVAAPVAAPVDVQALPSSSAIPPPPPTSSTTPAAVAPEDQGGDLIVAPPKVAPPKVAPAVTTSTPTATPTKLDALPAASADDPPLETGGVTELPARKKAKALTARAIASLRDGDVSGAEPALVRAVLIDPSLADAWRHLGIARAQLGDLDGARRAYRKYLELAPKAPDAAEVRAILAAP